MAKKKPAPLPPTRVCPHPKSEFKILNGGLAKCGKCGAIRGADGQWRWIG